jgi:retron-type reverse transcriptase
VEKVIDRDDLLMALRNVKRNRGAPGIDGMTVEGLPDYLKRKWPKVRGQLLDGNATRGALSPLLANLMLDNLDRELERRGHRFVSYADGCSIYVKSKRAGSRVLWSISRFLEIHSKLSVNKAKSAVDRPWRRQFLGFTLSSKLNRRISVKSIKRFKNRIREITCRIRGRRIGIIVKELRQYILGWQKPITILHRYAIL